MVVDSNSKISHVFKKRGPLELELEEKSLPGDIALNKAHVLSARAFAQAQAQGVGERVECGSAGADFGPLKFRGAVCGFARASGGAPKGPRVKCRRVTSPCVSYLGRGDGDDQSEGQATGEHRY